MVKSDICVDVGIRRKPVYIYHREGDQIAFVSVDDVADALNVDFKTVVDLAKDSNYFILFGFDRAFVDAAFVFGLSDY